MIHPWFRRFWLPGLACLGALAMLVLGDLPRSAQRDPLAQASWALPAGMPADPAAADAAWAGRQPWGNPDPDGISSSSADGPQTQAVGVVQGRLGLQAVFLTPGTPLIRLSQGEGLPGGGVVTRVSARRVEWTTPAGESRSRTLLSDPLPSPQPASAAPGAPISQ